MRRFFPPLLAALSLLGPGPASAAQAGYVVKVEGSRIFLDLNASNGIAPGQSFVVFTEGEMLKHPVTGAALGPVEQTVASGRIAEVHDNYSLGELLASSSPVQAGQKIRLSPKEAPAPAAPPPAGPGSAAAAWAPYFRSPGLDLEAVALALGDVNGDGAPEVLVADKDSVRAYPFKTDAGPWTPSCVFTNDGQSSQILSLEAADLDGDKKDEVFVTLNNKFFNRVESLVLACKDGKFVRVASLPWMVGSYGEGGRRRLAVQQLIDDSSFPFSNIYPLEYAEGKYGPGKNRLSYKRLEWLYGFSLIPGEGGPAPIFLNSTNRIRIQFSKKAWTSEEPFGQTANRVRWHDRPLQFNAPLLPVTGPEGLAGLYVLKNIPRFGSLSEPFGLYGRAEFHYLNWNGLSLEPAWSSDLGGYAAGLAGRGDGAQPSDLLVAVVGTSGKTSIWFFRPPSSAAPSNPK